MNFDPNDFADAVRALGFDAVELEEDDGSTEWAFGEVLRIAESVKLDWRLVEKPSPAPAYFAVVNGTTIQISTDPSGRFFAITVLLKDAPVYRQSFIEEEETDTFAWCLLDQARLACAAPVLRRMAEAMGSDSRVALTLNGWLPPFTLR